MACGCNKIRTYTESSPLMLGDPDGSPSRHVRATIALMGFRANSELWVGGAGVDAMISAGWLVLI